jgi:hypothetical protein
MLIHHPNRKLDCLMAEFDSRQNIGKKVLVSKKNKVLIALKNLQLYELEFEYYLKDLMTLEY